MEAVRTPEKNMDITTKQREKEILEAIRAEITHTDRTPAVIQQEISCIKDAAARLYDPSARQQFFLSMQEKIRENPSARLTELTDEYMSQIYTFISSKTKSLQDQQMKDVEAVKAKEGAREAEKARGMLRQNIRNWANVARRTGEESEIEIDDETYRVKIYPDRQEPIIQTAQGEMSVQEFMQYIEERVLGDERLRQEEELRLTQSQKDRDQDTELRDSDRVRDNFIPRTEQGKEEQEEQQEIKEEREDKTERTEKETEEKTTDQMQRTSSELPDISEDIQQRQAQKAQQEYEKTKRNEVLQKQKDNELSTKREQLRLEEERRRLDERAQYERRAEEERQQREEREREKRTREKTPEQIRAEEETERLQTVVLMGGATIIATEAMLGETTKNKDITRVSQELGNQLKPLDMPEKMQVPAYNELKDATPSALAVEKLQKVTKIISEEKNKLLKKERGKEEEFEELLQQLRRQS